MAHRYARSLRRAFLCLAVAAIPACGGDSGGGGITDPPPPGPTPNFVRLQSDAGDRVGSGLSYEYTQANAYIDLRGGGNLVNLTVQGDETWSARIYLPAATILQPGTYSGLSGDGLNWGPNGCGALSGSVTVDSVTYTAGALTALDLRFEQHCDGAAAALRGTVHWRSDDKTAPPGPVNPPPAGLWQPPAGARPATGNYVYLQSDPGEYVGGGGTFTYTSGVAVIPGLRSVQVRVNEWIGNFLGMYSLTQLRPGYYGDLGRYPYRNPAKGGINWTGSRFCFDVTGWFVVDQVAYSDTGPTSMTALDLRFELHCGGSAAALHGAVHWHG